MGLSIARGLLAVEQGRIWAENCADGGARFTIVVPATVGSRTGSSADDPTVPHPARRRRGRPSSAPSGRSCASRGYDVEIAGTGHEAVRWWPNSTPDLIVLDLGLPDLDGTEVCRRIRETSKVPIIILSARGRRGRQGARARSRRRRLRHEAVRSGGAAGAHPRRPAPRDVGRRRGNRPPPRR